MINVKTILPTFLLFIYIGLEVSCVEYTVNRDRDDMVRILKEVCGSARYLLQNIMANKLKAPSGLSRGRVIRIDCFQKKNLFIYLPDKYQKSSIYVPGDSLLPTAFMDGGVTADQCKDRCASMTDCAFITYNKQGWCYFYGILYYNGRKEEEFDNDPKYDTYIRTDKDI